MKFNFLLALFMCTAFRGFSQKEKAIAYFDKSWYTVSNPNDATYYRTAEAVGKNYLVRDFVMATDSLQMEAYCTEIRPKLKYDGPAKWYFRNGKLWKIGNYVDDKQHGLFREFYEDGDAKYVTTYREDKGYYHQIWSDDGKAFLTNGTGVAGPLQTNEGVPYVMELKDSVIVSSFSIRETEKDSIYSLADKMPDFNTEAFRQAYRKVVANVTYPASARRAGIEGTVFVGFVVGKNGSSTDVAVIKGISKECNDEAMRAVDAVDDWMISYNHDKPVKIKFVLPVKFKLEENTLDEKKKKKRNR